MTSTEARPQDTVNIDKETGQGPSRDEAPLHTVLDLPPPITLNQPPPAYQRVEQIAAYAPNVSSEIQLPVGSSMIYEPIPRIMECPSCGVTARTILKREAGFRTHMTAAILFMSIMCIPFVWVPYCLKEVKDANHYCSACGILIGKEAPIMPYRTEGTNI